MSYAKLRGRIVERYGNITAFAKAVGMTRTNVSLKLGGRVPFTAAQMWNWSQMLGITRPEIGDFFFD